MGRKSSAKANQRPPAAGAPPDGPKRYSPLTVVLASAVVVVVIAAIYVIGANPATPPSTPQTTTTAVSYVPEAAKHGPHPQADLPPLPFSAEPPARSPEVVRAAYKFAAEHAEVLSYVPCYCGCEHSGHRGNEYCFVTARDAKGDVTEWEPHGMT